MNGPIDLYTTTWCPDCRVAKRILREMNFEFREIDIEASPDAAEWVMNANHGKRRVPTLHLDGQVYGNPPPAELKALLAAARSRRAAVN